MPLPPGHSLSGSRIFFASGGSGGGNTGQIPPIALGPLPSVGTEGTGFAYQVNAIGTLPLAFELTDGAVPTGMTFDPITGLITGTCAYPNGGLYNFTVAVTNDYGSVSQAYAILISGTVPAYSIAVTPDSSSFRPGTTNEITCTYISGSYGGSPAVPITFAFDGDPNPLWNATLDTATGLVTLDPDISLVGTSVVFPELRATNYFGSSVVVVGGYYAVVAPMYWGEWHGALPGTFTAANILTDLFDNTTPGPRTKTGTSAIFWAINSPFLVYPATGVAYARVLAVPTGFFQCQILAQNYPNAVFLADLSNINIPCANLTPAWPTPYQSGLVINNVPYDIYVVTARTTTITLLGNSL